MNYTILETGNNHKVLVRWKKRDEYSVHTLEVNGGLIWGHYFDNYEEASEYFNQYRNNIEFCECKNIFNYKTNDGLVFAPVVYYKNKDWYVYEEKMVLTSEDMETLEKKMLLEDDDIDFIRFNAYCKKCLKSVEY